MENTQSSLFVVATPIGNMGDVTLRALETLKNVDLILAEDTRVTKKLLTKYEINTPTLSCHEHTERERLGKILDRLLAGESMALVTDAGTPGLSDPGNLLVSLAREREIPVVPIPGVSALVTLISVAGIDLRQFVFKGFPPHKKGRETFFREVAESDMPVIYYESPYRVLKNLELLQKNKPDAQVIIGRELTKVFEEIVQGTVGEVLAYFREHPEKVKGEFVVIATSRT